MAILLLKTSTRSARQFTKQQHNKGARKQRLNWGKQKNNNNKNAAVPNQTRSQHKKEGRNKTISTSYIA
jgi:hypothetical protein